MRSFFTCFGSKKLRAVHYPPPEHHVIVEPFAGAAGYSTHYHDRHVILYDLDPAVYGTWDYLINVSTRELAKLPPVVHDLDDHPNLCLEAQWVIGWWLHRGVAAPPRRRKSVQKPHHTPGRHWDQEVIRRLIRQVPLIRHWRINLGCYSTIPPYRGTWFIDPPYREKGHHYRHRPTDYGKLADWCTRRNGQVIVCEHRGATWLDFKPLLPGAGVRNEREVVWTA